MRFLNLLLAVCILGVALKPISVFAKRANADTKAKQASNLAQGGGQLGEEETADGGGKGRIGKWTLGLSGLFSKNKDKDKDKNDATSMMHKQEQQLPGVADSDEQNQQKGDHDSRTSGIKTTSQPDAVDARTRASADATADTHDTANVKGSANNNEQNQQKGDHDSRTSGIKTTYQPDAVDARTADAGAHAHAHAHDTANVKGNEGKPLKGDQDSRTSGIKITNQPDAVDSRTAHANADAMLMLCP
ncbi:expressed unknown protein [Seminavis robusta]|uniref:Uncharacterized protein n=1 Tax=Seminavis robusta TaxID=568900 RepID=A0A9N8EQ02_9STRA|nr:expressed unknown protein [Seminavis robusta]|eukprot:Sro1321_g262460.1 n/a (246) ;mRNA; r:6666-7403